MEPNRQDPTSARSAERHKGPGARTVAGVVLQLAGLILDGLLHARERPVRRTQVDAGSTGYGGRSSACAMERISNVASSGMA